MRSIRPMRYKHVVAIAVSVLVAVGLAGCGIGSDSDTGNEIIAVNGQEPQNPLIPSATNEAGGSKVIDQLWAGLIAYQSDGGIVNEVADSITSDDDKTWTVKLKKGWKFSDGSPVQAHNFVDAWNYGALSTNEQLNSYFYHPIKGFEAVQASKPKTKTMSGLDIVNDYEFTITLDQAESQFPMRLGYSAFYPLPDTAFDDMEAFGENPVGNGPYKMAKKGSWVHNEKLSVVANSDYDGARKPKNGGLTFQFYSDNDQAYDDVRSGDLDILDHVTGSALTKFAADDDIQAIDEAGSAMVSLTIGDTVPRFKDNREGKLRRQALSMAIDRPAITEKVFDGRRTPAKDFTSPTMPGYDNEIDGADVLTHNADKAQKLWKKANKIKKWDGKLQIAYSADGDHQEWVESVADQLHKTLDIKVSTKAFDDFAALRDERISGSLKAAHPTVWQPDYPSMFNYLQPQFQASADANESGYDNPAFDKLLKQSAGADDDDKRYGLLRDAQTVLLNDLPAIPLWNENISAAANPDLDDVSVNWQNVPEYYRAHK